MDEGVNKPKRRLEWIEGDFRKLLGAIWVKLPGAIGSLTGNGGEGMRPPSLLGCGDSVPYGAATIVIQDTSVFDQEAFDGRRRVEEGEEGMSHDGKWAILEHEGEQGAGVHESAAEVVAPCGTG